MEKNSTLYIDLAKSNSRSKRSRTGDYAQVGFALLPVFPPGNSNLIIWYLICINLSIMISDDGRSGSEKRLKGYAAFPGGNPDPGKICHASLCITKS